MRRILWPAAGLLVSLAVAAPAAPAHQGNPNMESIVRAVQPSTAGVAIQVLSRDDRFELTNRSGKPIVIYGYSGDEYARLSPDGTVEVNDRSPAYYLNQDRMGAGAVPSTATATADPHWRTLDKTGRFEWHDHRMHYMGTGVPSQVKDRSRRQEIFDYKIPIRIGDRDGRIVGTLWWTPEPGGGPPAAAIAGLAVVVLAGAAAVVVTRRRRRGDDDDGPGRDDERGGDPRDERRGTVEAW